MLLKLEKEIIEFSPYNEQEKLDKNILLKLLNSEKNIFSRKNKICHFTASSWIINEEKNLLKVALTEAKEETGLENIKVLLEDIFSIEILTVDGHMKNGEYVSSHLHLNITYLLEANEHDMLSIKEDENSDVCWINIEESEKISKEEKMKIIYKKLNEKLKKYLRS